MDRRTFLKVMLGGAGLGAAGLAGFQVYKSEKKLNISFHIFHTAPHQRIYSEALMTGMRRYGIEPYYGKHDQPCGSDIAVLWGWKQNRVIEDAQKRGTHVLIMERGFIQPRMEWCSLAFDGLNGLGKFAPAEDKGERWEKYFSYHLQPWREDQKGYALLIGQVPSDASLHGLDIYQWLQQMADAVRERGWEPLYRPHPDVVKKYNNDLSKMPVPSGCKVSSGTLEEDLNGAAFCVIYASTTAVESVLAGVPAVITSPSSIAYDMGSHDLDKPFYYPDRTQWCYDMAWRQWTVDEFQDGSAWSHVRKAIS
jgi:hypothetical protein